MFPLLLLTEIVHVVQDGGDVNVCMHEPLGTRRRAASGHGDTVYTGRNVQEVLTYKHGPDIVGPKVRCVVQGHA